MFERKYSLFLGALVAALIACGICVILDNDAGTKELQDIPAVSFSYRK